MPTNKSSKVDDELGTKSYCEFCGVELKNDRRSKYCGVEHQQTAARRRIARRLGIKPRTSKWDPLYFN